MRSLVGVAILPFWLVGCATTYDCGLSRGGWQPVSIKPVLENAFLAAAVQYRKRPQWALNSLGSGVSWYRNRDGDYALCIPPEERELRDELGCFSERYVLRETDGEAAIVDDLSIICTD